MDGTLPLKCGCWNSYIGITRALGRHTGLWSCPELLNQSLALFARFPGGSCAQNSLRKTILGDSYLFKYIDVMNFCTQTEKKAIMIPLRLMIFMF